MASNSPSNFPVKILQRLTPLQPSLTQKKTLAMKTDKGARWGVFVLKVLKMFIHSICWTCKLIFCFWQRRSRSLHKDLENEESRSSKAKHKSKAGGSHGKQRQVEAVTLFEVVSMGRSAMQVKCGPFACSSLSSALTCCIIQGSW